MSEQQPVFSVEKLYVKDVSLELPNAPQCFLEREAPQVEVQLQTAGNGLGEGLFDVVLTATVTAKVGDKALFLVEVAQAGIFRIQNIPESELGAVMAVGCPTILFPYLREVVSDCVNRGGFPSVILAPVNFDALYQQQAAAAQQSEPQPVAAPAAVQ
jgi:preprotein translocase subunit SecB